jgi:Regulator of G protein signaling domain
MQLTEPTLTMVAANPRLRVLLHDFMAKEHSSQHVDFYFSTASNQVKYDQFIKADATHVINIGSQVRDRLRKLGQEAQWDNMTSAMRDAKTEVAYLLNDSLYHFKNTPEYSRWHVSKYMKLTDKGEKAFNLLKKDLGIGKKADDLKTQMLIVEGAATLASRKAAFAKINKMMKLTVKAAAHFRTAGLPVPA